MSEDLSRPYTILREQRIIRVYHCDLDKSWWTRGMSRSERDMKDIEYAIRAATGLQRVFRRHGHSHVDFVIRQDLFDLAAVAVTMQYPADPHFERSLRNRK